MSSPVFPGDRSRPADLRWAAVLGLLVSASGRIKCSAARGGGYFICPPISWYILVPVCNLSTSGTAQPRRAMSDREDLQLSAIQLEYLEWLVTPRSERHPESEAKWAETHHVDITTPRRWKRQAQFKDEWRKRAMALQGTPERTQEMLDSLFEQGRGSKEKCPECGQRGGDVRAAELWAKWTGQLQTAPPALEAPSLRDLTTDELNNLIQATAQDELARRRRVQAAG